MVARRPPAHRVSCLCPRSWVTPIRVLVGDLPGLLADVVTHLLESQPDIALVGKGGGGDTLVAAAEQGQPDVVILGLASEELPPWGEQLLRRIPSLRVLGVTRDRGRGFLYEMRPQRAALGELSPDGLVNAVRAATSPHSR